VSNSEEQLKVVEEINKKIGEVELTKKIINGLIDHGFSPDKRILYTIKITNIINTISKENNLGTFSVELSDTKK